MRWLPLFLLGCASTPEPGGEPACASCHGTAASAAPPNALGGLNAVSDRGVGAHAAHLEGSRLGVIVACTECHVVPGSVGAEGHIDDPWPADLSWGEIARTGGSMTTWNEDLSCSGSYCHGATLSGGTLTAPVWTESDGAASACDACHGNPPPAPHPADSACAGCHDRGAEPALQHVDGILQLDGGVQGCTDCHGAGNNSAPPPALNGATDSSDPGVGAHAAHQSGSFGAAVSCSTCHVVPDTVDAAGHLDGTTQVAHDGTYTPADQSCTTSCHGPSSPAWTGGITCGDCHGVPPAAPHPQQNDCESCHSTAGPGLTIAVPSTHIDGIVQVGAPPACDSCHGANGDPSPPPALNGSTDSSDPGVGAHAAHANPADATAVACADCHPVPVATSDAGHLDGTTDVVLLGRAAAGGVTPSYTAAGQTCVAYCHDPGLGGSTPTPTWTASLGACGDCHSLPPPSPHPASSNCSQCHSNAGPGPTITDPSTHLDGSVTF